VRRALEQRACTAANAPAAEKGLSASRSWPQPESAPVLSRME